MALLSSAALVSLLSVAVAMVDPEAILVEAKDASDNERVYTCIPGMITNKPGEGPRVEYLERYSNPNSENRPAVAWEKDGILRKGGIKVAPNGGHKNEYK